LAVSRARLSLLPARRFYIGVGVFMAVMALVGFWSSYFGPLMTGTVDVVPVLNVHAAVYSGWLILFVCQAILAANGKIRLHRKLGQLGIYYGLALVPVGVFTAFSLFVSRVQAGLVEQARFALLPPLVDMVGFPILLAAAVVYRAKPEIHKRLMVVATTLLLTAATARMQFLGTPVPLHLFIPVWLLPIAAAMTYDFVKKRMIHPVYLIGLASLAAMRLIKPIIASTEAWAKASTWLADLIV
jgi:hypothetical protein